MAHAGSAAPRRRPSRYEETYETAAKFAKTRDSMRARALTLIIPVIVWMTPEGGSACHLTAKPSAGPAHVHSESATAHAHGEGSSEHDNDHESSGAAHSSPDSTSGDSCCKRSGTDAPILQAAVQEAQPRPKTFTSVPLVIVASRPAATWGSAVARSHSPPSVPFAHSNRPLLV